MSDYVDKKEITEAAKKDWNSSKALRNEFEDLERYTAYKLAKANGQVKVLGKG